MNNLNQTFSDFVITLTLIALNRTYKNCVLMTLVLRNDIIFKNW